MDSMIKDDWDIIEGGIYLIITVLLAMVVYLVFLPLLAVLPSHLAAINPATTARFSGMVAHIDTSISLFVIFDSVMPFIFVALFAYLLAVYVVYRSRMRA